MKRIACPRLRIQGCILAIILSVSMMAGCGNSVCKCLEEAKKEKPDSAVLEKCREKFSQMDTDEVTRAVEKCGR